MKVAQFGSAEGAGATMKNSGRCGISSEATTRRPVGDGGKWRHGVSAHF
jgi:hypothetical protein